MIIYNTTSSLHIKIETHILLQQQCAYASITNVMGISTRRNGFHLQIIVVGPLPDKTVRSSLPVRSL